TYVELRRLGAGVRVVNVGGGLAVDYDGSASPTLSSKNYSMKDYAEDIVWRLKDVCERAGEPAPTIYSESGRAMTAFSSLLVTDVVGSRRFASDPDLPTIRRHLAAQSSGGRAPGDRASGKKADTPASIDELVDAFERVTVLGQAAGAALTDPDDLLNEVTGILHDASQARDEAVKLYQLGYLSLTMRAAAERLYWAVGRRVLAQAELACATSGEPLPTELAGLPPQLADILFCNFSVFQSLPDHWAIRQIFPVAPIHRLDEKPTRRATLADMSCDSDGRVDRFPSLGNEAYHETLPVHEGREGEVYYLGVFLVGAYQEVLGDLHNLFGDTHVVHVSLDDEGRWRIDELIEGDTVRNVLEYVQHNPAEMKRVLRRDAEAAMRAGRLTTGEGRQLLSFCESGLDGYTYLEE
ncbi:MAG: biosynthetic arginine decarboxylase, partial [Planctomycetota bacterium]